MTNKNIIPTGFQSLDEALGGGFHNGSLNVVAARPGFGKTTFVIQCAYGMSKNTERQIYIQSLKCSSDQVKKIISDTGKDNRIIIDDTAPLTLSQIRKNLTDISDLGAVIIDYFQLIQPNADTGAQSFVRNNNEIVGELALMAKELNVPVICTSQLSSALEERQDCRPILSDLDRHGAFTQNSDVVIFLYRDAYYNRHNTRDNSAEVIISKNCYGDCKTLSFYRDYETGRFVESKDGGTGED